MVRTCVCMRVHVGVCVCERESNTVASVVSGMTANSRMLVSLGTETIAPVWVGDECSWWAWLVYGVFCSHYLSLCVCSSISCSLMMCSVFFSPYSGTLTS